MAPEDNRGDSLTMTQSDPLVLISKMILSIEISRKGFPWVDSDWAYGLWEPRNEQRTSTSVAPWKSRLLQLIERGIINPRHQPKRRIDMTGSSHSSRSWRSSPERSRCIGATSTSRFHPAREELKSSTWTIYDGCGFLHVHRSWRRYVFMAIRAWHAALRSVLAVSS